LSNENLETVRRLAAAFNDRDVDRFVAELDPEVEFHSLRAQLEGRPYVGHEGARRMFADFDEDWAYLRIEVGDLRDTEVAVAPAASISKYPSPSSGDSGKARSSTARSSPSGPTPCGQPASTSRVGGTRARSRL
jgi:SnoaL-like domain